MRLPHRATTHARPRHQIEDGSCRSPHDLPCIPTEIDRSIGQGPPRELSNEGGIDRLIYAPSLQLVRAIDRPPCRPRPDRAKRSTRTPVFNFFCCSSSDELAQKAERGLDIVLIVHFQAPRDGSKGGASEAASAVNCACGRSRYISAAPLSFLLRFGDRVLLPCHLQAAANNSSPNIYHKNRPTRLIPDPDASYSDTNTTHRQPGQAAASYLCQGRLLLCCCCPLQLLQSPRSGSASHRPSPPPYQRMISRGVRPASSILLLAARAAGGQGRRGIHTWYSISTSGVTRVRFDAWMGGWVNGTVVGPSLRRLAQTRLSSNISPTNTHPQHQPTYAGRGANQLGPGGGGGRGAHSAAHAPGQGPAGAGGDRAAAGAEAGRGGGSGDVVWWVGRGRVVGVNGERDGWYGITFLSFTTK